MPRKCGRVGFLELSRKKRQRRGRKKESRRATQSKPWKAYATRKGAT